MMVRHFRDLRVYQMARASAAKIYVITKRWPKEERYSLIDQIRRASRSVAANIAEAWRKRRYLAHFVSKLSDADAEAGETQAWLDSALECGYVTQEEFQELDREYEAIGGGLVRMMANPERWCGPAQLVREEPGEYALDL